MHWYLEAMTKYAVFGGRASRKEYWMFQLVNFVILVVLIAGLFLQSGRSAIGLLAVLAIGYVLVTLLPGLAVSVRRLHDTNLSGWWILIGFVPLGGFVLLVFHLLESNPGPNQYGPNPTASVVAPQYAAAAPRAMLAAAPGASQQHNKWFLGFCTACGAAMQGGERFCPKCGKAGY